jgi:hypothetical protein
MNIMSGGRFDYNQYRIGDIYKQMMQIVKHNDTNAPEEQEFDYRHYSRDNHKNYRLSPEVIEKFKEIIHYLMRAEAYAERVDWLLSGDDDEDGFFKRINRDLRRIDDEFNVFINHINSPEDDE